MSDDIAAIYESAAKQLAEDWRERAERAEADLEVMNDRLARACDLLRAWLNDETRSYDAETTALLDALDSPETP